MLILGILAFGMIIGGLAQLVLGMGPRPHAQSLIAGIAGSFVKFAGIFAVTQVPLAIAEGLLTVVVAAALVGRGGDAGHGFAPLSGGR